MGSDSANGAQCLVAWDSVCKAREDGGLGIKRIDTFFSILVKQLEVSADMVRLDLPPESLTDLPDHDTINNIEEGLGCNDGSNGASFPSSEHGAVTSRCSVKLIHDIVSKFSVQKIQLVRSIGFEGILHIPLLKQINLKFSSWLMSRVDVLSRTLVIADGTRIELTKDDVACVFGIPCTGNSIFSSEVNLEGCSLDVQGSASQPQVWQFRSIKAAQAIVSRQDETPMSSMEQDKFRAAFVVFVMSTLLAPCAKHDRVSDDYLHAIRIPEKIGSYDWAEYVLRRLLDAVAKLKADIANNVKTPYIYGCSLFLQVFYLDSIDLGILSLPHVRFPRIRCFTADRLRSMIAADSSYSLNGHNMFEARRIKLRTGDLICYHWARCQSRLNGLTTQEPRMREMWDLAITITRVLKIPPEAAPPLFIVVSDFQRQLKCTMCPDALKVMDVLLHILEPYVNGFKYKPSISQKSRPLDLCQLGYICACKDDSGSHELVPSCGKRKHFPHTTEYGSLNNCGDAVTKRFCGPEAGPSNYYRNESTIAGGNRGYIRNDGVYDMNGECSMEHSDMVAINAMSRFYLTTSRFKDKHCLDLNLSPYDDGGGVELCSTTRSPPLRAPRSPWELGFSCSIDVDMASEAMRNLHSVEDADEPWIAHYCPKYIEVITRAVKEQFLGESEFEMELVDAVIRRFKQLDDEIYAGEGRARWRHFVESDFMVSLLAGRFGMSDPGIRALFCGSHINYDVTVCRIIFFPLILHHRWVCFAWRMYDNTIVVYDPCIPPDICSEVICSYERVVKMLKSAMAMVASKIFGSWSHDWHDAKVEIFDNGNVTTPSANRTGLLCLYFCRYFDGVNISPPLEPAQITEWSAKILGELSLLGGNMGLAHNFLR